MSVVLRDHKARSQQFSVHLHNKSSEVSTVIHISQVEKPGLRMHCCAQDFEDRYVRLETSALLVALYCPIVRVPGVRDRRVRRDKPESGKVTIVYLGLQRGLWRGDKFPLA